MKGFCALRRRACERDWRAEVNLQGFKLISWRGQEMGSKGHTDYMTCICLQAPTSLRDPCRTYRGTGLALLQCLVSFLYVSELISGVSKLPDYK